MWAMWSCVTASISLRTVWLHHWGYRIGKTGAWLAGPDLVSRGFVYVRENESLMDGAQRIG